ncbi:MAG: hypothetical protein GW890_10395, partial [Vibrio sp.]|nr:hypothetical protein [Vibrio sp.]
LDVSKKVKEEAGGILDGSLTQANEVTKTISSIDEINNLIKGISKNTELLSHSAEESASSVLEIEATTEEVDDRMGGL